MRLHAYLVLLLRFCFINGWYESCFIIYFRCCGLRFLQLFKRRNECLQPFFFLVQNGSYSTCFREYYSPDSTLPYISVFILPLINTPFVFVYVSFCIVVIGCLAWSSHIRSFECTVLHLRLPINDFSFEIPLISIILTSIP